MLAILALMAWPSSWLLGVLRDARARQRRRWNTGVGVVVAGLVAFSLASSEGGNRGTAAAVATRHAHRPLYPPRGHPTGSPATLVQQSCSVTPGACGDATVAHPPPTPPRGFNPYATAELTP